MGQAKRIFIDNFGFKNRGDQLMIQSVLDQIQERFPNSKVFLRKNVFLENPTYCINNHLYPLRPNNKVWPFFRLLNFLLRGDWFATPNQIDVVLDCCGYHITDTWLGDESGDAYEKYYARFNKRGRKIIFLPQAFGPFNNIGTLKTMRLVHRLAALIYARDAVSKNYIEAACGEDEKVKVAPDFTCLCPASLNPVVQLVPKQYVAVIANFNMVYHTSKDVGENYMNFMAAIINHLIKKGEQVYLCNHEGERDEELLHQINQQIVHPLPILTNLSGIDVKAVIRDSKLLITARYHGLVSALTQGVPALCTTWSHKYAELLNEFACPESILDVTDIEGCISMIDDALNSPNKYISPKENRVNIENKTKTMWNEISRIL